MRHDYRVRVIAVDHFTGVLDRLKIKLRSITRGISVKTELGLSKGIRTKLDIDTHAATKKLGRVKRLAQDVRRSADRIGLGMRKIRSGIVTGTITSGVGAGIFGSIMKAMSYGADRDLSVARLKKTLYAYDNPNKKLDPTITDEEYNRLYRERILNSLKEKAVRMTLITPEEGFAGALDVLKMGLTSIPENEKIPIEERMRSHEIPANVLDVISKLSASMDIPFAKASEELGKFVSMMDFSQGTTPEDFVKSLTSMGNVFSRTEEIFGGVKGNQFTIAMKRASETFKGLGWDETMMRDIGAVVGAFLNKSVTGRLSASKFKVWSERAMKNPEYEKMIKTGGFLGILEVAKAIQKLPLNVQEKLLQRRGMRIQRVLQDEKAQKTFRDNYAKLAPDKVKGAMQRQYKTVKDTPKASLFALLNEIKNLWAVWGLIIAKMLQPFVIWLGKVLKKTSEWLKKNKLFAKILGSLIIGFGLLLIIVGIINVAFYLLLVPVKIFAFIAALINIKMLVISLIVLALVALIILIVVYWDEIVAWVKKCWDWLKNLVKAYADLIGKHGFWKGTWIAMQKVFDSAIEKIKEIWEWMKKIAGFGKTEHEVEYIDIKGGLKEGKKVFASKQDQEDLLLQKGQGLDLRLSNAEAGFTPNIDINITAPPGTTAEAKVQGKKFREVKGAMLNLNTLGTAQ